MSMMCERVIYINKKLENYYKDSKIQMGVATAMKENLPVRIGGMKEKPCSSGEQVLNVHELSKNQ